MTTQQALRVIVKPLVFVASLGPVAWLTWAGLTGHLSVNPLSDLTNETGVWALRFLCISIAITPLRRLTGWNWVIRFRRMLLRKDPDREESGRLLREALAELDSAAQD